MVTYQNKVLPLFEGKNYPENFLEGLERLTNLWISQKLNYKDTQQNCELGNKYRIYAYKTQEKYYEKTAKRKRHEKMFKCKEKTKGCQKYCFSNSMREMNMEIYFNKIQFNSEKNDFKSYWIPCIKIERKCTCSFLCINRPIIEISTINSGNLTQIGFISDNFAITEFIYEIYETKNQKKPIYTIKASCFDCGIFCHWPCGSCEFINFDIIDNITNQKVGEIKKTWPGCAMTTHTHPDDFAVKLPMTTEINHKILLLSAVLFIDYKHFEERGLIEGKN